ncbi:MAG: DNA polymerase IV [Candidatus Eisenbacteria bacterium]
MRRIFFHLDMDAFFSAIEQLSNPSLKGKPVIICGDPHRRSVVSTASYEARKYGLKSGMPIGEARRLCPHGIYVTGNPKKYVYTSVQILNTLREFTSLVEPFSVDEAFLEFHDLGLDETPRVANAIKQKIRQRFGLTCSIGVGPNKIVAKMASEIEKPDGFTIIEEGKFLDYFGDKEVRTLWGIGEKTSEKLNALGVRTICDLAQFPEKTLTTIFGEYGTYLKMTANGRDESPLVPYFEGIEPKSIGHEYTLSSDTSDQRFLVSTLLRLSEQVGRRMRKNGYVCDTVTVKIRYKDFKTLTRQHRQDKFIERDDMIFERARKLFLTNYNGDEIRLLGVSASGLIKKDSYRIDPMFSIDRRKDVFVQVADSIKDRFGEESIKRGGSFRT